MFHWPMAFILSQAGIAAGAFGADCLPPAFASSRFSFLMLDVSFASPIPIHASHSCGNVRCNIRCGVRTAAMEPSGYELRSYILA